MPSTYPIEVDIQEAKNLLDNQNAILIDVREILELGICQIENSKNIPMNKIPQRLEELPKEGPLLIQCHHGGRSLQVVHYLRQNGFENAINMGGGIEAWALNHDSSMQRY
jgi:adenylyltransferase/sulfurtransferase